LDLRDTNTPPVALPIFSVVTREVVEPENMPSKLAPHPPGSGSPRPQKPPGGRKINAPSPDTKASKKAEIMKKVTRSDMLLESRGTYKTTMQRGFPWCRLRKSFGVLQIRTRSSSVRRILRFPEHCYWLPCVTYRLIHRTWATLPLARSFFNPLVQPTVDYTTSRNCIVNAVVKNKQMIMARNERLGKAKKRKTRKEILAAMDLPVRKAHAQSSSGLEKVGQRERYR